MTGIAILLTSGSTYPLEIIRPKKRLPWLIVLKTLIFLTNKIHNTFCISS